MNQHYHHSLSPAGGQAPPLVPSLDAESILNGLLDHLQASVFVKDRQGRILAANAAYCRLLDIPRERLLGTTAFERFRSGDSEILLQRIRHVLDTGQSLRYEARHVINHEPRSFSCELFPLPPTASGLETVCGIVEETTQREAVLEALRKSEARYRAVVEDQTEVISRFRADGTFLFANDVYCRVFGKTREELLGTTWHPVCLPEDLPMVEAALTKLSQDNPLVFIENRVITGSGEVVWMQFVNRGFFDEQGVLQEIQSVGRDITLQKQLQLENLRAARLASLGELAAGVAHEINNPINGIINCGQLLADDLPPEGQSRKLAEMVMREGRRIARIVRSLLSLAREDISPSLPIQPGEALTLALDLVNAQLEADGVRLRIDLDEPLPLVLGSKGRLQQVFLNLLTNAQQALNQRFPDAHPDKTLRIRAETVEQDGRSMAAISFLDNGAGIAPELLARVFDPFFSTKGHGEGTGLGLPISRNIIVQHGGRLELTNRPEGGVLARVLLPALPLPVAAP